MISILLGDDHTVVRIGLRELLSEALGDVRFGEATTAQEVLDAARKEHYDLAIIDINMPGRSGLDALKELRQNHPDLPVLILSMMSEAEMAMRALRSGAAGYLTKERASDEILNAVKKVLADGRYITTSLAERLAFELEHDASEPLHKALSDREYQVMRMIALGKTVGEIAEELSLSVKTISTHRTHVLQKLALRNNAEIMRYALLNRLVD